MRLIVQIVNAGRRNLSREGLLFATASNPMCLPRRHDCQ